MAAKVKELKAGQEPIFIYYRKGYTPMPSELAGIKKNIKMEDYIRVCDYPIWRAPNHTNATILETLFELFNWVHEGFQPTTPEIGFDRGETYHTSMSIGDIIQINEIKYLCDTCGWIKL